MAEEKEIIKLKTQLKLLNNLSLKLEKKIRDVKTELERRGAIKFYEKGDLVERVEEDEFGNYETQWRGMVKAKKCEAILFIEDIYTDKIRKVNANDSSIVKKNGHEV